MSIFLQMILPHPEIVCLVIYSRKILKPVRMGAWTSIFTVAMFVCPKFETT